MRAGSDVPSIGLLGGDLCRTVGGTGDRARLTGGDAMRLPVDVGHVVVDGREHWFVAHLVARRSWWRGEIVAVMNAEFIGHRDVAPRGHPNDGKLDVVRVDRAMSTRARWQARRRLSSGTYLPHPHISIRPLPQCSIALARPLDMWLDGVRVARGVREITVRCLPDVVTVVV